MALVNYRNFLRLLEKWPVDKSKPGRDLGEHIRNCVFEKFSKGEATKISNPTECLRIYESLLRLSSDAHSKKFIRSYDSTSTGISPKLCGLAVSDEYLNKLT